MHSFIRHTLLEETLMLGIFPSSNFPNLQFSHVANPPVYSGRSARPLARPSRTTRPSLQPAENIHSGTFWKWSLGILNVWEIAIWEIVTIGNSHK